MGHELYGGNRISVIAPDGAATTLAADAYEYRWVPLRAGEEVAVREPGSWTLYVLRLDPDSILRAGELTLSLADTLQIEHAQATVRCERGAAVLLVSGVRGSVRGTQGVQHHPASSHYRVAKPWGHELWLNGEHPSYCLKEVFIRAGHRTSLQYHRLKRETNLLTRGRARLVYLATSSPLTDTVTAADLAAVDLDAVSTVDVTPMVLHRLEAVTDLYLYETSTPHLDDVVRVQDDAGRGDGRIAGEHQR